MKLSIIIPTLNEEKNIVDCLKSVNGFASEVIVIDMGSIDKTIELAKKSGAKIIINKVTDKIQGIQTNINLGIKAVTGNWIMRIDADERLTSDFKKELKQKIESNKFDAFYIGRKQWFINGFIIGGDWAKSKIIRIFRKGNGFYDLKNHVHEKLIVNGHIGEIKKQLLHYSHPDIETVMDRFNKYTDEEAIDKALENRNYLYDMITQPIYVFIRTITIKGGWRDRTRGVVAALIWSFYQFLSYAKAWELKNKSK